MEPLTAFAPWAKEMKSCKEEDDQHISATKPKLVHYADSTCTSEGFAVLVSARSSTLLSGMLAAPGRMKELDLSDRQLSDETICSLAQALIDGAMELLHVFGS